MSAKPLSGVKVLDFSRILAGPFCTMLLGDLGADVVKVESFEGDPIRDQGPPFYNHMSMGFMAANRNKRSLCADLKDPDDIAKIKSLAQVADVVVESFRPGVMERLGIGPDDMMALNPRLIYARISGMGASGPLKNQGAFDLTTQALGGFMSITGEKDGPPVKLGTSVFDLVTGQYAMGAITAALHQRHHTGQGALIETSLYEGLISFLVDAGMEWLLMGTLRERLGSEHASLVPYRAFRTADGWLIIAAGVQAHYKQFVELLGLPELADDSRFAELRDRVKNRKALDTYLDPAVERFSTDAMCQKLESAGIPCSRVNTLDTVFTDDQTLARNMVVPIQHEDGTSTPVIGPAVKYSSFDVAKGWTAPPSLGADTDSVLVDWLGLKSSCNGNGGT